MTDREKAIVTAYTGIAMLTGDKLEVFYKYVESLVNRPVFTHELAYIDLKALSKNDFLELCASANDEQVTGKLKRPCGEWVVNNRYRRKGKIFLDCSVCHYGENGDVICEVKKTPRFCPNCGAEMVEKTPEDVQEGDK